MTYQEVAFSATRMPVPEKLALIEVLIHSLREDLPTGEPAHGSAERLLGAIKTATPPDDDEIRDSFTTHLLEKHG